MACIICLEIILIREVTSLGFKQVQFYYIISIVFLYLIFSFTRNINERFDKGRIIKKTVLRGLLWIKKNQVYISYVSLVFAIIGYIYLIALIPLNIICLFVSDYIASWITYIYLGMLGITWLAEIPFLPFYGIKG